MPQMRISGKSTACHQFPVIGLSFHAVFTQLIEPRDYGAFY
jgi:hypothetical protein